ncbi:hypothetical protein FRX31_009036 [Thalictrum thalictroides]|uniref:Uncharacterized protein n=1 Tax=Thalictrum thalictroides TaxID=46969 RepID=A0A7J6WWV3_THATH|nr:hypothetical protein FRX31_009036 [Thalictrum thalictroides]
MVETRAAELQSVIEERNNLREELRALRFQQGLREADNQLEEVAEESGNRRSRGDTITPLPPPRPYGSPRRLPTVSSMGTREREEQENPADDPDMGVD